MENIQNKTTKDKKYIKWPFWIQMPTILFAPVAYIWATTPTNVLNSSETMKTLEHLGIHGLTDLLPFCLPVGLMGLSMARKRAERMNKLRAATIILSWINIVIGSMPYLVLLIILINVTFFGLNH